MTETKRTLNHREEVFELLRRNLAEMTDNRWEDIHEHSLIFGELNLTEYDLQRIIKQIGSEIEIDTDELLGEMKKESVETVADVVELLVDEKELG